MNPEDAAILQSARELDLATIGRRTGTARRVELWFAYDAGYVYFLAGVDTSGTPTHWYRNLQAHPQATIHVGGRTVPVRNEPVEDAETLTSHVWELFLAKYGSNIMRRWYGGSQHLPVKLRVGD